MSGLLLIPLLAIVTVICLGLFVATTNRKYLKALMISWGSVALLQLFIGLMLRAGRPIRLNRNDVVGVYRVDRSFYPGINADWQFAKYSFEILHSDSIVVRVRNESGAISEYRQKLIVDEGPPFSWQPVNPPALPVFAAAPVLFRGTKRFYYVIPSKRYGNMFFRRSTENMK